MSESMKMIVIRVPAWMKKRFDNATKPGERSKLLRKKIMEIVQSREEVNEARRKFHESPS